MASKKNLAILGSTGSIGLNTLDIVRRNPGLFNVIAISAYNSIDLVISQIKQYKPKYVALKKEAIAIIQAMPLAKGITFVDVDHDLELLCSLKQVDIVVLAMRSAQALKPFLAAAKAGKIIAPANKEALVIAGDIIMKTARRYGATVIPVDSEQSAIFQCLDHQTSPVKKVHLTASGGPLLHMPKKKFKQMKVKDILKHPRWAMGAKITVDSATLMNKGFEFIEAQRLFNLSFDQIKIVVHPQAIIHSMVEFYDGSILAQLGITDMRLPIQYALTYPKRLPTGLADLDFVKLKTLDFYEPDLEKFPSLALALESARLGGTMPAVLNAADEEAVEAFLKEKIAFTSIYKVVEKVVSKHKIIKSPTLEDVLSADCWARGYAKEVMGVRN